VSELSEVLASYRGTGYVVAPAGHGKTHLIAEAVGRSSARQLVLTHTYAGVYALRRKMRELSVRSSQHQIDTVASWALRLSLSYPESCAWTLERPSGDAGWTGVYEACTRLLDKEFVRRIIRASYTGMYVDEYQDCSTLQHSIVLKLARDLPCRVLGDPLQAIFDFGEQRLVNWQRDIEGTGEELGRLETPHRWNIAGAPEIGKWLGTVRQRLESGQPIDLASGLPAEVKFTRCPDDGSLLRAQGNSCRFFRCAPHETVIAIHKGDQAYKAKCHVLAKNVSGAFSSIEEIEGKSLFSFINDVTKAKTSKKRLTALVELAGRCMTAVNENLSDATKRGELVEIRSNTKNPDVAKAANTYLQDNSSENMVRFLEVLKTLSNVRVARSDLLNRVLGVLRKHTLHPKLTLLEAADKYQGEFRYKGRPVGRRKLIGTTLLVKGLEFQHSIVLDAGSLSRNELYVALTRGAKTLTILSKSSTLNPAA